MNELPDKEVASLRRALAELKRLDAEYTAQRKPETNLCAALVDENDPDGSVVIFNGETLQVRYFMPRECYDDILKLGKENSGE